jgi:hypothetical protein
MCPVRGQLIQSARKSLTPTNRGELHGTATAICGRWLCLAKVDCWVSALNYRRTVPLRRKAHDLRAIVRGSGGNASRYYLAGGAFSAAFWAAGSTMIWP